MRSTITGEPLVDAIVRVPALRKYTLTNATGEFLITGVPRGVQTAVVAQLDTLNEEPAQLE